MAFDILKYYNDHKGFYGDMSLEDVARDAFKRGFHQGEPDYDTWKQNAGITQTIDEDNRLRNPTLEDKLRMATENIVPKIEKKQSGGIVKSFLQGGAEGLTTEIPSMVGGAIQFAGSHLPFDTIKNAGKSLKDWAEEKRQELYGPEIERTGLDRIVYEGTKMLAPSLIPGLAVGTVARGMNVAAKSAVNIAGGATAGLFGLSQAQQTKDTAEERGVDAGAAPYLTGAIEAAGEFLGTKYLAKLFRLDETEIVKRGAKQFITDLIKTIGVEVGTEIGQQGGEAAVEKYSGIRPEASPVLEAIDVIGPTTFMTLLTGGLAGAANKLRSGDTEEKTTAKYLEQLKAGAMFTMTIHEGLRNGEVDGKPFTPDHAIELIKRAQNEGIYSEEDIDWIKQQYPSLSDGINNIIADNVTAKVNKAVKNIPLNTKPKEEIEGQPVNPEVKKLQDRITKTEDFLKRNSNRKGEKRYNDYAARLESDKTKLAELKKTAEPPYIPEGGVQDGTLQTETTIEQKGAETAPIVKESYDISELPPDVRKEAEKTVNDDYMNNLEGDLRWRKREMSAEEIDNYLSQNNIDHQTVTESGYKIDKLIADIKKNGIKTPIVIGPESVEGNHRLLAAKEVGIKSVPVWEYIEQTAPEQKEPWQMTKREFSESRKIGRFEIIGSRLRGDNKQDSDYDVITELTPEEQKTLNSGEFPILPKEITERVTSGKGDVFIKEDNKLYSVVPHPEYPGEFWMERVSQKEANMLAGGEKGESRDYTSREDTVSRAHQNLIQQALSDGKTVPPEVLKDYPELQKKESTAEEEETPFEKTPEGEFALYAMKAQLESGDAGLTTEINDSGLVNVTGRYSSHVSWAREIMRKHKVSAKDLINIINAVLKGKDLTFKQDKLWYDIRKRAYIESDSTQAKQYLVLLEKENEQREQKEVTAGEIEGNRADIQAATLSEIADEGNLTEEQYQAAQDEISSFFDEVTQELPRTEKTDAGEQATLSGMSEAETFSLTAKEPETPVVKGNHLAPKNLQPKEKNADMFADNEEQVDIRVQKYHDLANEHWDNPLKLDDYEQRVRSVAASVISGRDFLGKLSDEQEKIVDQARDEGDRIAARLKELYGDVTRIKAPDNWQSDIGIARDYARMMKVESTVKDWASLESIVDAINNKLGTKDESKEKEITYENIADGLQQIADKITNRREPVIVSDTPVVLEKLGAEQLPIVVTHGTIEKATIGKHGISFDTLKQLPEQLADPVMIFDSNTQAGSLVVMTELRQDGKTIIAAVDLSSTIHGNQVNNISTIHQRDSEGHFLNWINKGLLRYMNRSKSRAWALRSGLQLPRGAAALHGLTKHKILYEADIVKGKYVTAKKGGSYQLPNLTEVQDVFKGQEVKETKDGFIVNLQSGKGVLIKTVDKVTSDIATLEIGYSKTHLSDTEVIAGHYKNGKIELVKGAADKWVLSHESSHFMEDLGIIRPLDIAALRGHIKRLVREGAFQTANKEDIGGSEDRANFIADALNTQPKGTIGRIINRIQDFIDKLINLVHRTARGVVRDVQTGKIYNEKPKVAGALRDIYDQEGLETGRYNITAETFYSQLLNTVTNKIKEMPAKIQSIIPWLNKNNVKPAEMKWMGVEQWLKDNAKDGAIDKQAFADFLKSNQIEIREVTKGTSPENDTKLIELENAAQEATQKKLEIERELGGRVYVSGRPLRWLYRINDKTFNVPEKYINELDEISEAENNLSDYQNGEYDNVMLPEAGSTKFSQYTLPGGENYRELLLTLPGMEGQEYNGKVEFKNQDDIDDFLTDISSAGLEELDYGRTDNEDGNGEYVGFNHLTGKELSIFREITSRYNANIISDSEVGKTAYHSPHWEEPNVLAHVRMNDRVIPSPKAEQFNKDYQAWIDNGKKGDPPNPNNYGKDQKILFIEEVQSDWHQEGKKKGYKTGKPVNFETWIKNKGLDWSEEKIKKEWALRERSPYWSGWNDDQLNHLKVPPAPFAENWHELVMKRMLRYAAENGYDKIAWTTGEQQAERYDLSREVEEIKYERDVRFDNYGENIRYVELVTKNHGEPSFFVDVPTGVIKSEGQFLGKKLDEVVGKEIAKKILTGKENGTLSGLDLKVGGEGMKSFYDNLIPGFMNKYVKQWGAKVGETQLYSIYDDIKVEGLGEAKKTIVPSVDITPQMKHDVMFKGQAYYSIRKMEDPPVSKDPKVLNFYLKDETDAIVQTIINKIRPKSMTWLETMLKSPEWFDHPQIQNIVKLFMRDRNEIYHETFNDLNMTDDPNAPESTVTEAAKALKNKGLTLVERLAGKVSPEYKRLQEIIDEGDTEWKRNKKLSLEKQLQQFEDHIRKNPATTDDVIRVWKLYRQSYDKALDLMTQQLRNMIADIIEEAHFKGDTPDLGELKQSLKGALAEMEEWKGFYAPRLREQGNWKVQAYKAYGPLKEQREWYREHRGSELAAQRLANKLKREGWTIYNVGEVERIPETIYQDVSSLATAKLIDNALEKISKKSKLREDLTTQFNEEILREVSNAIKARGFRSSMIHRGKGVVRGFIEDPIQRHLQYINNISGGISKARVARMAMAELLGEQMMGKQVGGIDPVKEPKAFATAQDYIQEQLRNADNSDRIIGLAKSIATFKFLGFNLRSLAVNMTAVMTTAPAAIHQYAMGGKGSMTRVMNELARAGKDYGMVMAGRKLANADEQAFMDEEHRKGWDDPQYTRAALGELSKTHSRIWSSMMDGSMWLFGKSEKWNRGTTMLAAYRLARKNGMGHEEAAEAAKTSSDRAHGVYGKSTMPMWAEGTNPAAKLGQMMYVYSKFGHNYLQMLYDLGFKKHNIKGAMFAFLSPLVLAGAAAFPFKDAIFAFAGALLSLFGFDRDPEKFVWDNIREHLGMGAERLGRHGLTGALGIDISGSLSIGVGIPKNFIDLTGAIGGVATELKEAGESLANKEPGRAAEHLLPTGLANPLRAMREGKEGVTTRNRRRVWNEEGRPYVPGVAATATRVLGFRSTEQAVLSERTWEGHRQQAKFAERRSAIYERYRAWLLGGRNRDEYKKIVKEVQDFNRYIRENKIRGESYITSQSLRSQARRMMRPSKKERAILQE